MVLMVMPSINTIHPDVKEFVSTRGHSRERYVCSLGNREADHRLSTHARQGGREGSGLAGTAAHGQWKPGREPRNERERIRQATQVPGLLVDRTCLMLIVPETAAAAWRVLFLLFFVVLRFACYLVISLGSQS